MTFMAENFSKVQLTPRFLASSISHSGGGV